MRALAAPTSLKGALSAVDAADALAVGLRAGGAEVDVQPVADGGDGTLDVLGGDPRVTEVAAPLGGTVRARWSLLPVHVSRQDGGGRVGAGARLPHGRPARSAPRFEPRTRRADPRGGARGRVAARLPRRDGDRRRRRGDARGARRAAAADARRSATCASRLLDAVYVFGRAEGRRRGATWSCSPIAAARPARRSRRGRGGRARRRVRSRSARSLSPAPRSSSMRSASTRAAMTSS